MSSQISRSQGASTPPESEVRTLYQRLIEGWNRRDADAFAVLFREDGECIGFDGSQMSGSAEIAATLQQIFLSHQTAPYLAKVKSVRFLAPDVAILRAIVGMVPPGQTDLNPAVNSLQTLVATRRGDQWFIALLQNTPAQFHGRPELVQQMTDELRQLL